LVERYDPDPVDVTTILSLVEPDIEADVDKKLGTDRVDNADSGTPEDTASVKGTPEAINPDVGADCFKDSSSERIVDDLDTTPDVGADTADITTVDAESNDDDAGMDDKCENEIDTPETRRERTEVGLLPRDFSTIYLVCLNCFEW
jgi:hypothetical protein